MMSYYLYCIIVFIYFITCISFSYSVNSTLHDSNKSKISKLWSRSLDATLEYNAKKRYFFQLYNTSTTSFDLYMLKNSIYKRIPDLFTAERLGYDPIKSKTDLFWNNIDISNGIEYNQKMFNLFSQLNVVAGIEITTLIPIDKSLDEVLRVAILKINILQEISILNSTTYLGMDIYNPAITKYKDTYIIVHRGKRWKDQQHNYFRLLDESFTFEKDIHRYGLQTAQGNGLFYYGGSVLNNAEDIRMMFIGNDDTLLIYSLYATMFAKFPQVTISTLRYDVVTGRMVIVDNFRLIEVSDHEAHRHHTQKNWVTFMYNDNIYFIKSFHPFLVYNEVYRNITIGSNEYNEYSIGNVYIDTVTTKHCSTIYEFWKWGEIRGGTTALLIRGLYITFFHSRVKVEYSNFETYFMGVLAFSNQLPFELQYISEVPIVFEGCYVNEWCNCGRFDYVIFPMGFIHEIEEGTNREVLHISFGRNDQQGFIGKIYVDDLMDSLIPLDCLSS